MNKKDIKDIQKLIDDRDCYQELRDVYNEKKMLEAKILSFRQILKKGLSSTDKDFIRHTKFWMDTYDSYFEIEVHTKGKI